MRETNHLSVHQWIRSAIRESQQPTPPIGFLFFETSATALCGTTGIFEQNLLQRNQICNSTAMATVKPSTWGMGGGSLGKKPIVNIFCETVKRAAVGPGAPPEEVRFLHGRETGICYYGTKPLAASPSAAWLMHAKAIFGGWARRLKSWD